MRNEALLERIERTSRASGLLIAVGCLAVLVGLWISYLRLQEFSRQIARLQTRSQELHAQNAKLETKNATLRLASNQLSEQLSRSRQALEASRYALEAFHQHDYLSAISWYDQALSADPNNAYLLNLKAYSLFKLGHVSQAIVVQRTSVVQNPSYAWGFFDLARFECAARRFSEAREALATAFRLRPMLRSVAEKDGEFQKLCKSGFKKTPK